MECMIESIFKSVDEHVNCHKNFQSVVNELRRRVTDLNRRRNDKITELKTVDYSKKQVKEEVQGWLEDARRVIEIEMPNIEEKVQNVRFLLRGRLGRRVRRKIQEVREIYDRGCFSEGLVIERPHQENIVAKEPAELKGQPQPSLPDGRTIGKLIMSNTEIAKGSNGTIVLQGFYEGRSVAVKRLVLSHHDVADKEIQHLTASDWHPNIVRWYAVERDRDFIYLALERCSCSMDDLIQIYSDDSQSQVFSKDQASRAMTEYKVHLESVKGVMQDLVLWKDNGHPSPLLLKLMRDVVAGLAHLHELGIIHRDLKPQNVLIIKEKYLCAKVSDMGISKRLLKDKSSLHLPATGCGSSGWQAPEQLSHERQTRAVDMFSLGCVLFFCITGGMHPFGDRLERDINIVKSQKELVLLEGIPEAEDLISCLLNPDPDLRPNALEVLHHPLFWNPETRLSFLRDASDKVELEDREPGSQILKELEGVAPLVLDGKWDKKMETAFITNIGHHRRYKFDSVRDLLRLIRNKLNHYRELPKEIQELVGPVPEGFDNYFAVRYPKLLIQVYKVIQRYCREEHCFQRYFKGEVV